MADDRNIEWTDEEIDTLRSVVEKSYRKAYEAEPLLRRLGFPMDDAPMFGANPREAWYEVFGALRNGVVDRPYLRLLELVIKDYPHNKDLRPLADRRRRRAVARVLVVGASPDGQTHVRGDREMREIRRGAGAALTIEHLPAAAVHDLRELVATKPDVLHLACHAGVQDLVFEAPDGAEQAVSATAIRDLLATYRTDGGVELRALVLNCCYGSGFAGLFVPSPMTAQVPVADVVVAHRGALDDDCAVTFAGEMYRTLGVEPDVAKAARIAAATVASAGGPCGELATNLVVLPDAG